MCALSFASILLSLASLFGFINHRFLRLPNPVGLMVVSLAASLCILGLDRLLPAVNLRDWSEQVLGTSHLPQTLLNGALSLMLFAGALHVQLNYLWSRWYTVLLLATLGCCCRHSCSGPQCGRCSRCSASRCRFSCASFWGRSWRQRIRWRWPGCCGGWDCPRRCRR
jgi:hypothetical protein